MTARINTPSRIRAVSGAILCLLAAMLVVPAFAESISVRGEVGGIVRNTVVDVEVRDGVKYVPLGALSRQLGIGFELTAGRVRVDLEGRSAWIHLDTSDVDASTGPFALGAPLLRAGQDVLIAVNDLPTLLSRAFRLDLAMQRVAASRGADQDPDVDDSEESAALADVLGRSAAPLRGRTVRTVVLDPGRGGADEGATLREGMTEKDFTLALAQRIKKALEEEAAVSVALTRDEDIALSDAQRVLAVQRAEGDLLVTLHAGVVQSPRTHGVAVFCHADQPGAPPSPAAASARRLAQVVAHAAQMGFDAQVHDVRELPLRLHSKLGGIPAILVEAGYASNPADAARLSEEAYQQELAEALAAGIAAYVREQEGGR